MEKQYIEIAKGFSGEIRRQYPEIDITSIRFVSISDDQVIDVSVLPYNLDDAKYIIVICDFDYPVNKTYSSNFFILFIDDKGKASNKIDIDEWRLSFDEPVTGGRVSPARRFYLTKNDIQLTVSCTDFDVSEDIAILWKLFMNVKACHSMEEIRKYVAPYSVGNTVYLYKMERELKKIQ